MTLRRLKAALEAAHAAFLHAWHNYDEFEARKAELEAMAKQRQAEWAAALGSLNESDKHFVGSFLNNLTEDTPLDQRSRYVEILDKLPVEGAVKLMRQALKKCPSLVSKKPVRTWVQAHAKPMALAMKAELPAK